MTSVETEPAEPGPQTTVTTAGHDIVSTADVVGDGPVDGVTTAAPTSFGRDRIVAFVAVFLLAMSSFPLFAWVSDTAEVFKNAPDLLDATRLPATFPFVAASTDRDGAAPAMAWIPIALVVGTLVVTAFRPIVRRIGYLVLGAVAVAVSVLFVLALGEALSQAGSDDLWIAHVGPGSVMFAAAGVALVAAAILVPRRRRTTDVAAATDGSGAHDHLDARPVIDTGDAPGKRSHPPESAGHSD